MTARIKSPDKRLPRVRVTGPRASRVEPEIVAKALGADIDESGAVRSQSPLALIAVRQELLSRLTSTGGRPGLEGTTRRQKIPLDDEDWGRLRRIAEAFNDDEVRPTPGQVASVLLHRLLENIDVKGAASQLHSEIAAGETGAHE
jgi:hypothetical protein